MKYLVIISSILAFIVPILIYEYFKLKKEKEKIIEDRKGEIYNQLKTEAERKISNELNKLNEVQNSVVKAYNNLNIINKEISTKKEFNENLIKIREEEIERLAAEKEKQMIIKVSQDVEDWSKSAQEAAELNFQGYSKYLNGLMNKMTDDYQSLKNEIEDYQKKKEVINQEILRQRAIEEKQDFYKIILDTDSKEDIEILNNVKFQLKRIELLNKLIYENYISRPAKEMIKRVLEGKNPSGIYKVTNIKTNEIYIGKSVKVADRFLNHIKSACGLDGVAESQFQRALKKYGIDCFVWELLEETSKEKLTEREKYYISFYGTKEYGYNQREG